MKPNLCLCIIANPNSVHTRRWVRYFANCGYDIHLIGEKPLAGAPPEGVTFHDLTRQTNVRKLRYIVWAHAVRRLVRKIRPDVLHAHQVASAGWLSAAAGYHPLLVTSWGSDLLVGVQRSTTQRQLARWVLHRANYVTCVSSQLVEAARALGVDAARVELTPWGVDTTVFHPGEAINDRAPVVLSIRGLKAIYNPLVIAQAIPIVLGYRSDAHFVIRTYSVDANLLTEFERIVTAGGAAQAVEYVDDVHDDLAIAELYRQAAVAVSVPSSDGTPQSVLEAMACGTAPVVSDLPSLRDWLRPGVEGLFVPVSDAGALAEAVLHLLDDHGLRRSIQAAAVRMVRERADSRLWMQRYEQIYQQLAAGQRPQQTAVLPGKTR
jgi:glycosyltransferase involved in cell wall biosynthesis